MDLYTQFSNLLLNARSAKNNTNTKMKKLDKNTSIERTEGQDYIIVRYHNNIVMWVWKCGVTISDGGYGYSVSLKRRLNKWLPNIQVFTEQHQPKFSALGYVFPLNSKTFFVTNRFGGDSAFFAERLAYAPKEYVEKLVELHNIPECGPLMVACDQVLTQA